MYFEKLINKIYSITLLFEYYTNLILRVLLKIILVYFIIVIIFI